MFLNYQCVRGEGGGQPQEPEARKHATILFCDWVGPGTALTTGLTEGVNPAGREWQPLALSIGPIMAFSLFNKTSDGV